MLRLTSGTTRAPRTGRKLGLGVITIGLAHFLVPRAFDPINRLGFPDDARRFTYVNGAIETTIGILLATPGTRRLSTVVSACYVAYLTANVVSTHASRRPASAE